MAIFRTRLGWKLLTPVILVLALFSFPIYLIHYNNQVVDRTSDLVSSRDEAIDRLNQMESSLKAEQLVAYEIVFDHRSDLVANFQAAAANVQFWHDQVMEHVDYPSEAAALEECQTLHNRVQSIVMNQIVPMVQTPNPDHTQMVPLETEMNADFQRISDLWQQLSDKFTADKTSAMRDGVSSRAFASEMIWASIAGALLLGLIIAGAFAKRLIVPIKRLAEASVQVARGDLSQRIDVTGHDELASAARSFNGMADSLERRTLQLEREKARIRSIHQSIGDGIVVVDRGGIIISVNPAAERILGHPVTQLERTTDTGVPKLQEAITRKIKPDAMVKCWEAKDCKKEECPAHGSIDRRCWLQRGTYCYNQIQGTFKQKRDACERCDVFLRNAAQELTLEIGHHQYSTSIIPILDDEGQEEGRTVVMHDVTEVLEAKDAVERHSAELAAINSISEAVSESLDLETTISRALDKITEFEKVESAAIHMVDPTGKFLELKASRGLGMHLKQAIERIPIGEAIVGKVAQTGSPAIVGDRRGDEDENIAEGTAIEKYLSILCVPLKSEGRNIGTISFGAVATDSYTEADSRTMTLVGNQLAAAIENSIMYEESLRLSRYLEARNNITTALAANMEIDKAFKDFSRETGRLVDFDHLSIIAVDEKTMGIKQVLTDTADSDFPSLLGNEPSVKGSTLEAVIRTQQPYMTGMIAEEPPFRGQEDLKKLGLKSKLNLPLITRGRCLGTMNLGSRKVNAYDEETIDQLQPVAKQVALALANQELFEDIARAKNEWEKTFDSASEGIVMIREDHHILRLNKSAARMMGGSVEEFVGRLCYEVIHDSGEMPQECLMKQSFSGSSSIRGEQEMDDGRTIELVVDPVYGNAGHPIGAIHFMRDITEAKRLRKQLLQSEKMIAVGQLVAGVAHEINNPLTGVIGYAQLLMARDIDDQTKKDAEGICHEAERATRIVRHLLSFARKYQPERKTVDINAVLRETIELKEYELRVNNIHVEAALDDGLPLTAADPHQLQQVFLNLINNAEQAMREDRGTGLLKVSTQAIDGKIRISFVDNGPGVPEDIRGRIFDPFFTTKEVGKGTGLGLSVCYGVAQDHGGRIWVEPSPDRGATIIMELPVETAVFAERPEGEPDRTKVVRRSGKVLLVDDEAAIRKVLSETLKQAGHEVDTAVNGEVALRMLKQKHYDCVVSDVKMPSMDGPSLHRAILGTDPALAGSFIFISGDTISPDTKSYLDRVDNPRLAKPFDRLTLKSCCKRCSHPEPKRAWSRSNGSRAPRQFCRYHPRLPLFLYARRL